MSRCVRPTVQKTVRSARTRALFRCIEGLEPRVLFNTFVVSNVNDSGPGSLRQAMLSANSSAGADTINFNIAGTGVQTITPLSPLPTISDTVTIDGTTQPGYSATAAAPVIEISGGSAGVGAVGLAIGAPGSGVTDTRASNTVVRGLIINRFSGDGVIILSPQDKITGCYIGTDATGAAAAGNGGNGITVGADIATIGGSTTADRNVISANALAGIEVYSNGDQINGNYIGTTALGTAALGNRHEGIRLLSGTAIGGHGGNVISGNGWSGIYGSTRTGLTSILGNYIGTDATGSAALGNGASPTAPYRDGITLVAGNASIGQQQATQGLGNVISGNKGAGIFVGAVNQQGQINGNLIGTDATGTAALGNAGDGIVLAGQFGRVGNALGLTSSQATVIGNGGNVISGNGGNGILVLGPSNTLQGNYIGTNLAGTAALGNAANGVEIRSSFNNTIGGQGGGVITVNGTRTGTNLISGNGANGILIDNPLRSLNGTGGNQIQGNLIGTNATGTNAVGNAGDGVRIVDGFTTAVGGRLPNLISGNGGAGVSLRSSGFVEQQTGANQVIGNYIGTNAAGTAPLGNGGNGVEDFEANDTVGMPASKGGNLISGNGGSGVYLGESPTSQQVNSGVKVQSNLIGTDASGHVADGLGNRGDGVTIFRSSRNIIGGQGNANTIAGNAGNGVTVDSGGLAGSQITQTFGATRNAIEFNSIFSNGRLGIDLGNNGVTPNDPGDLDTGPNMLQNYPVILSATGGTEAAAGATVRFALDVPTSTYIVQFFANDAADPSGFGEGQRLLLTQQVSGRPGGTFTVRLPAVQIGTIITATATDAQGDTSEFSAALAVTMAPPTVTASSFDPQTNTIHFTFSQDVSASLSTDDLRVHNNTTGQDVPATGVTYDAASNTATFQLPGNLPGGSYVVTLLARGVTNSAGQQLDGNADTTPGDDYTFTFSYKSGDVTQDAVVNFADLLVLGQNYGKAGTFAQGDLNHDGRVDFADLLILAQGYSQGSGT